MMYNDYIKEAEEYYQEHSKTLRRGQAYMIHLHYIDEVMAEKIEDTEADPFYDDRKISAFLTAVQEEMGFA